jgi:hypothetical protein
VRPISIGLQFLVISLLLAPPASATCGFPDSCYCSLVPEEGGVLFRGEVLSLDDTSATLRVLGIAFHDPEGLISSGRVLAGLTFDDPNYVQGDVGIFLVQMSEGHIPYAIVEEGGRYPCYLAPSFHGLTMDQLAQAVLSDNCVMAVYSLGLRPNCPGSETIVSGCCGTSKTHFLAQAAPLVFALGILLPRRRFRKR